MTPAAADSALATGRIRVVGTALLIVLAAVLALSWASRLPLQSLGFDAYQAWMPREVGPSLPVTIVQIDERSVAALGRWPWPRTLLARLVDAINHGRPAVIGIDILMPEPDPLSPERALAQMAAESPAFAQDLAALARNDDALARSLAAAPTVLAVAGAPDETKDQVRAVPIAVRDATGEPADVIRAMSRVAHYPGALTSLPLLNDSASGWGFISADDSRGVIRRVPLVASVKGTLVPALAAEMWRVALNVPAMRLATAKSAVQGVEVGDAFIATEDDGGVRIHFSPRKAERFVSAVDVIEGRADPQRMARPLMLIAVTALALGDYLYTPGDKMPGSEIHAQLIESIAEGSLLRRPSWGPVVEALSLLLLGGLLVRATPRWNVRNSTLLALAFAGVIVVAGCMMFRTARLVFDAATPATFLVLLYGVLLALTLAAATRQRRALQQVLQLQREENARVTGELQAARRVQMDSLPRANQLRDARVELAAFMEPAREVGGDLYDFYLLDERRLFFMLGDVAGKGLSASIFMAVSKALCKSTMLRSRDADLAALMSTANDEVARDNPGALFVTAFAGVLDLHSGELVHCNAGHENPYLVRPADGTLRRLAEGGGPPLCAVDGFAYQSAREQLRPGDMLCVFSDGISEARDASGTLYGASRIEAALATAKDPDAIVHALSADVAGFAAGVEPGDDISVLALRWRGPGPQ